MTTTESDPKSAFEMPAKEESESFGTWLRRQRELREITLREIADTSKISLRYLQALEEDRFDMLPAPVFAKGFLRQYARYVGIDPEEAVNFYLSVGDQGDEEPELEEILAQRRPKAVGTWPYAVAVVVVAIVLMAVVWILLQLNRSPGNRAAGLGVQAADLPAALIVPQGATETPANAEAGEEDAAPLGEAGALRDGAPQAAGADTGADGGEAAMEEPESLYVTLDFRDDCWVRATVDGETREDRVYTQGESLQLFADELVELELGNAFAVEVEVEGHPMDVGAGSKNPVRRLSIDRATAVALQRGGR